MVVIGRQLYSGIDAIAFAQEKEIRIFDNG